MNRAMKAAVVALCLFALAYPGTGHASPPTWSFNRASLGVSAQAAIFDGAEVPQSSSFLPAVSLAYSLTSQLALVAVGERDFAREISLGKVGARMLLFHSGEGQIAAGVNLCGYGDKGIDALGIEKATSWSASLHGSWAMARDRDTGAALLFAVGSAEYDPDNSLTTYRLGLRLQAIGARDQE